MHAMCLDSASQWDKGVDYFTFKGGAGFLFPSLNLSQKQSAQSEGKFSGSEGTKQK